MKKRIFILLSRIFMKFFYDSNYLTGKHFDNNVKGWLWCWKCIFMQKILGYNRHCPYPVSFRNVFGHSKNIIFHPDDLNNFQHFGVYIQSWRGKVILGRGTYIAPNVGIITQNHDLKDLNNHKDAKDVILGENCWIGMNSVILPGVKLGENTIVAAGSVVTKSFEEGNAVIGGVPAKFIKYID